MTDDFLEFLSSYKGSKICVVDLSGGNHGDTCILIGLIKRLREEDIEFDLARQDWRAYDTPYFWKYKKFDYSDYDLTIIRGGGYINDVWMPGFKFLVDVINRSKEVVCAPHSFWFRHTFLADKLKNLSPVTLFAREKYSYEFLRGSLLPENVEIGLAPDSGFYLDSSDLIGYITKAPRIESLICFREDIESKIPPSMKENIMINNPDSLVGNITITGTFSEYISKVSSCKTIHTDRLHLAMIGAMLGKTVYFYPNSYWKNRGVYEYSLFKFNNVSFVEAEK